MYVTEIRIDDRTVTVTFQLPKDESDREHTGEWECELPRPPWIDDVVIIPHGMQLSDDVRAFLRRRHGLRPVPENDSRVSTCKRRTPNPQHQNTEISYYIEDPPLLECVDVTHRKHDVATILGQRGYTPDIIHTIYYYPRVDEPLIEVWFDEWKEAPIRAGGITVSRYEVINGEIHGIETASVSDIVQDLEQSDEGVEHAPKEVQKRVDAIIRGEVEPESEAGETFVEDEDWWEQYEEDEGSGFEPERPPGSHPDSAEYDRADVDYPDQ